MIMVAPDYAGPIIVRGRQLDGPNGSAFGTEQGTGDISDNAVLPGQWRTWGGRVSGPPGCYGLQVDGEGLSEVIVFAINSGPPPPA
jgi:hypothetical protein